ncbi:MAG: arginine--tRNA ligase [Bacteroidetes bacterium]|nr:MAG: arginine--tRNA ligase [Bacteroidota bacterium]
MRFEKEIRILISEALKSLYDIEYSSSDILLQETKKEFVGDLTLVVFPFTKQSKKSPELTAEAIGKFLVGKQSLISGFNVVKGFLNLEIQDKLWFDYFKKVSSDSSELFDPAKAYSDKVRSGKLMVEYSSPNTNKPLHLGHVRNNLLGYSVSRILRAAGNEVSMVNLINDRGVHICKSMLAWQKFGNGETPQSAKMKGDHLVGKYYVLFDKKYKAQIASLLERGLSEEEADKQAPLQHEVQEMLRKWEAGDPETIELWKRMNSWVYAGFEETYKALGVEFDKIYYESETYLLGKEIAAKSLEQGVFYKKEDGSIWIDLTDVGLDNKVVLRADGTSVYITQDMGTAQLRFDENPGLEKLIYVVGNEQDYHFKVLKEIFRKLGRPWADGLYHLSYGMVDLPSGKMKSREGTVVDADELIAEIVEQAEMTTKAMGKLDDYDSEEARKLYHDLGMGALKYFILKVDPKKRMLFNPAESIDLNGNTGPFIQYTHARIKSVLSKGKKVLGENPEFQDRKMSTEEKALIKLIYNYPDTLQAAAENLSPALMANYAYDVAKSFNHFYHDHVIVDENEKETSAFRLRLSELTSAVIKQSMSLLGIAVPERM